MSNFLEKPSLLSKGVYLQLVVDMKLLDDAIIRSNEPEEVLTHHYEALGNRFVIPWRKVKGKLRRLVLEKQRGYNIQPDCALKDDLCLQCPSCLLFGGTGETSSKKMQYNILSRVLGETFISTNTVENIQNYTQNAVGEKDLMTGQALMTILTVPKETVFKGVVTIKDPTKEMVSVIADNLKRLTRIGARSVEWGRVETNIVDYKLSDREDISVYNLLQNQTQQPTQNNLSGFISDLPAVNTAYTTLNNQIPELLKDLIERRSPKKDKKSKTKGEEQETGGE
ncbi:MAG: type I-D CRISPR-associated protein Cas7/Csc2 [Candidatus Kuenenia sp.]|nr:type I-D CRISPR-associated protein Cas7/Csc2 [Candidatus Kuenenia hertensis]